MYHLVLVSLVIDILFMTCHANLSRIGETSCIGKNLALMDIKLVISSIVQKYHINFNPQEDGHRVFTEMQDHFTATPGPLSLVFKHRIQ